MTQDAPLLQSCIAAHFLSSPPPALGVAVSGGSDSLALLHLLADWGGAPLRVVTVDHGLRAASAGEARDVAALCRARGITHDTLVWDGWDGHGNLSDAARRARYDLMAQWAFRNGIRDIALGHTADDQAETLLMRLARRAGLDGLAAMSARRAVGNVTFHRPMLRLTRAGLRADLTRRGVRWIDDPTNADSQYRRVRARSALAALQPLGVTAEGLTQSAYHLAEAQQTIAHYAALEAGKAVSFDRGDVLMDRAHMSALRPDIARRILNAALLWVAGDGYGARGHEIGTALDAIRAGQKTTLYGCLLAPGDGHTRISRELAPIAALTARPGDVWDGRWHLSGPDGSSDTTIRALGPRGRMACPDWRDTGLPLASVEASPGVWQGETLIAAPLAGWANGWSAKLGRSADDFRRTLLSH